MIQTIPYDSLFVPRQNRPITSIRVFHKWTKKTIWPLSGADWGGGDRPPLTLDFQAPFNFSIIFFASLHLAYYFFNILLFHRSNSKIFQPHFTQHMISHLKVFGFGLSFTHFRLLGVVYKIISN